MKLFAGLILALLGAVASAETLFPMPSVPDVTDGDGWTIGLSKAFAKDGDDDDPEPPEPPRLRTLRRLVTALTKISSYESSFASREATEAENFRRLLLAAFQADADGGVTPTVKWAPPPEILAPPAPDSPGPDEDAPTERDEAPPPSVDGPRDARDAPPAAGLGTVRGPARSTYRGQRPGVHLR